MENAPDPGPRNKPTRPQPKSAGANRKPQPGRKPTARRQGGPAASPRQPGPVVENEPVDAAAVVERPEEATDTPSSTEAAPAPKAEEPGLESTTPAEPVEHPVVPRLTVPRLTLPKLSLPKFSIGRTRTEEEPAPEAVEVVEVGSEPEPATTEQDVPVEPEVLAEPEPEVLAEPEPETAAEPEGTPEPEIVSEPEPEAVTQAEALALVVTLPGKRRSKSEVVLLAQGLTKKFDDKIAVNAIELEVKVGAFYGIVGPNGAGKTTTLSMITGLLRPTAGSVAVHGADVWTDPVVAKRNMGVLPDRLRLFDRLTGAQVLYYAGVLRGLDGPTARKRTSDLAGAFGLENALARLVTDYSAGMTKKVALAAAMIHSPRILVLDEPFESVDPVSAATITEILKNYVGAGGTVVLSSHSMDLVQRICDHVAVIVGGVILADGTMKAVRGDKTLEERFVELAGGRKTVEGLEWLHSFSD